MAFRQPVAVAKRADVLHDDMVCPIPAMNWKEEALATSSPTSANTSRSPRVPTEVCPIAPQDWRSNSTSSDDVGPGTTKSLRGGSARPQTSTPASLPPRSTGSTSSSFALSPRSSSGSAEGDAAKTADEISPSPSGALPRALNRASTSSAPGSAAPSRSFSGEMSSARQSILRSASNNFHTTRRSESGPGPHHSTPMAITKSPVNLPLPPSTSSRKLVQSASRGSYGTATISSEASPSPLVTAAQVGSARKTAVAACQDWNELDTLCTSMDLAGIRIDQIDLTTLADEDFETDSAMTSGTVSPASVPNATCLPRGAASSAGLSFIYGSFPPASVLPVAALPARGRA